MIATEELRRLLDERGVEHYDGTEMTLWLKDGVGYRASADEGLSGFIHLHLWCTTPEQAIAATLGWGMLTADDVRDLIERHSDASGGNGRDFHNGAYVAIADELNATLGSCNCSNIERTGTCQTDETDTIKCWVKCKDEPSTEHVELIHVMECSACGGTYEYVNGSYEYCPRCGRKVVDE